MNTGRRAFTTTGAGHGHPRRTEQEPGSDHRRDDRHYRCGVGVHRLVHLGGNARRSATKAFYSDDDGKICFVDEAEKIAPFDHNGKPAYKALVASCDGGKNKFVVYLQRYTAEAKKILEQQKANAGKKLTPEETGRQLSLMSLVARAIENKKPGGKDWVGQMDPRMQQISEIKCPNGGSAENAEFLEP